MYLSCSNSTNLSLPLSLGPITSWCRKLGQFVHDELFIKSDEENCQNKSMPCPLTIDVTVVSAWVPLFWCFIIIKSPVGPNKYFIFHPKPIKVIQRKTQDGKVSTCISCSCNLYICRMYLLTLMRRIKCLNHTYFRNCHNLLNNQNKLKIIYNISHYSIMYVIPFLKWYLLPRAIVNLIRKLCVCELQ